MGSAPFRYVPAPAHGEQPTPATPEAMHRHILDDHLIPEKELRESGISDEAWHEGMHSEKNDADLEQGHWHFPGTIWDEHKPSFEYVSDIRDSNLKYYIPHCACGWNSNIRSEAAAAGAWSRHVITLDEGGRKQRAGPPTPERHAPDAPVPKRHAAEVDDSALDRLHTDGGFTVHDETGERAKGPGYLVSMKGHQESFDPKDLTAESMEHYRVRHGVALGSALWGGWDNRKVDGKLYLDVSEHHPDFQGALTAANKHYQQTFFRLPQTNGKDDQGGYESALTASDKDVDVLDGKRREGDPVVGLATRRSAAGPTGQHLTLLPTQSGTQALAAWHKCLTGPCQEGPPPGAQSRQSSPRPVMATDPTTSENAGGLPRNHDARTHAESPPRSSPWVALSSEVPNGHTAPGRTNGSQSSRAGWYHVASIEIKSAPLPVNEYSVCTLCHKGELGRYGICHACKGSGIVRGDFEPTLPPKDAAWLDQVTAPYQQDAVKEPKDDIEPIMPPIYEGVGDPEDWRKITVHPVDIFSMPKTGAHPQGEVIYAPCPIPHETPTHPDDCVFCKGSGLCVKCGACKGIAFKKSTGWAHLDEVNNRRCDNLRSPIEHIVDKHDLRQTYPIALGDADAMLQEHEELGPHEHLRKTGMMYVRDGGSDTFHIWDEAEGEQLECGHPMPEMGSGFDMWVDKPDEGKICHQCFTTHMEEGIQEMHRERQKMIDESKREFPKSAQAAHQCDNPSCSGDDRYIGKDRILPSQAEDFEKLRQRILGEGEHLVAPEGGEGDLSKIVERGQTWDGRDATLMKGLPINCHGNAAALRTLGYGEIATGYASSENGYWRQHSWAVGDDNKPIETTVPRVKYHGAILNPDEADKFVAANSDRDSYPGLQRKAQVERHCVICKDVFSESEHGEATGFCGKCREKEGLVTHHSWSDDAQEGHYGAAPTMYWRAHPHNRPFSPDDASSREWASDDVPDKGYSALPTPHRLVSYFTPFERDGVDSYVVNFSGKEVGRGLDDEPLVMPDMKVVNKMSWDELHDHVGRDVVADINRRNGWEDEEKAKGRYGSSGCQNTCSCKDTGVPCECTDCVCHQKSAARTKLPSIKQLQPYVDTGECTEYAEAIARDFPELRRNDGAYVHERETEPREMYKDHAWVSAEDGTIIDTTHGQHDPMVPILIARPGTKEHARYLRVEDMTDEQRHWTYGDDNGTRPDEPGYRKQGAAVDDIPPRPGTAPIPEGHVRIYHATWADPEVLKREGLSMQKARESYERGGTEYPAIFGYTGHHPALEAHESGGGANVVEYHLHPDDLDIGRGRTPEDLEGRHSTVTTMKDVPPENIVAVHEPWHAQYHTIKDDPRIEEAVMAGEHDWAMDDDRMKPLGDAIRRVKRENQKLGMSVQDAQLETGDHEFTGALPIENGLYWRVHPKGRPLDTENAHTTPNVAEDVLKARGEDLGHWRRPGYSAFWSPNHLTEYVHAMGWQDDVEGAEVIGFRGHAIGEGYDGEPAVTPHSETPEHRMTWERFQDRVECTPHVCTEDHGLRGCSWGYHHWTDQPHPEQQKTASAGTTGPSGVRYDLRGFDEPSAKKVYDTMEGLASDYPEVASRILKVRSGASNVNGLTTLRIGQGSVIAISPYAPDIEHTTTHEFYHLVDRNDETKAEHFAEYRIHGDQASDDAQRVGREFDAEHLGTARREASTHHGEGPWFHGTNADLKPGDAIVPGKDIGEQHMGEYSDNSRVWLSNIAWRAGAYGSRIYLVEPHSRPKSPYAGHDEHHTTGATVIRELSNDEVGQSWNPHTASASPSPLEYKQPGVQRISIEDPDFPGDPNHPYFKEPGTVAFLDHTPHGNDVFINYAATHHSQQGQGHAAALLHRLYDQYPGTVEWGRIMDPPMGTLYERFKADPELGPRTHGHNSFRQASLKTSLDLPRGMADTAQYAGDDYIVRTNGLDPYARHLDFLPWTRVEPHWVIPDGPEHDFREALKHPEGTTLHEDAPLAKRVEDHFKQHGISIDDVASRFEHTVRTADPWVVGYGKGWYQHEAGHAVNRLVTDGYTRHTAAHIIADLSPQNNWLGTQAHPELGNREEAVRCGTEVNKMKQGVGRYEDHVLHVSDSDAEWAHSHFVNKDGQSTATLQPGHYNISGPPSHWEIKPEQLAELPVFHSRTGRRERTHAIKTALGVRHSDEFGAKTAAFGHNIEHPLTSRRVTIDTHMTDASGAQLTKATKAKFLTTKGGVKNEAAALGDYGGNTGGYGMAGIASATLEATRKLNESPEKRGQPDLLPHQVQAIVWTNHLMNKSRPFREHIDTLKTLPWEHVFGYNFEAPHPQAA